MRPEFISPAGTDEVRSYLVYPALDGASVAMYPQKDTEGGAKDRAVQEAQ